MSEPPVPPPTNDCEHLKILAIFHYICGGLMSALMLFNLIESLRMRSNFRELDTAIAARERAPGLPELPHFDDGPPMVLFLFPAVMLAISVSLLIAARLLQRRHGFRFIFIVACLECFGFPLATVLGVFTIIVLLRPSVKQLSGGNVKL